MTGIPGAIKEVGALLNKLFGNYKRRVRESLIGTASLLVDTLCDKNLKKARKDKLVKHYCKKFKADRKKLR